MAGTNIDTLTIKITANAQSASGALKSLANSLQKVHDVLSGFKDGQYVTDRLADSFKDLNEALNKISTSAVKKLQKLAAALNEYTMALDRAKKAGIGGLAKGLKSMDNALGGDTKSGEAESEGSAEKTNDKANATKKLGDETKKAGEKAKKAAGFFGKFIKSIGRIMLYRAIRSALKAIGEAFDEGLKNAYHYSQQSETFTRLADTLDRVKSITSQMVNQIGALWGEIRQFIMPAVEWLVEHVRKIAEYITEFMAALNGETTYLQAQYVEQKWDDATEAVKKYKHQLLGLDELNNLTKQESNKKEETDYSKLYKEMPVSQKLQEVGKGIRDAYDAVKRCLSDFHGMLLSGIGLFAIGAILTFLTTHKLLGIGLMLAGGYLAGKAVAVHWQELYDEIDKAMDKYHWLFVAGAIGLTAIGAALLFTTHWMLGLGCILAGVAIGATAINMSWDLMKDEIKHAMDQYRWLFIVGAIGLTVLGAALLFTGHYMLGLGCLLSGVAIGATEIAVSWTQLRADIQSAFQKFGPLFAIIGLGSMVVGALLLFTGHIGLGLALLIGGGFLAASAIAFNWDGILDGLKSAWESIKNWWNSTVVNGITNAVGWVNEKLGFNSSNTTEVLGGLFTVKEGSFADKLRKTLFVDDSQGNGSHSGGRGFASGGIPTSGSLFYAGESGAEFVGNIGTTSAVANTEQMTDAIYKAAYMGMSKALKENGGGGMGGFEPATMDDLFIAMRRKSNEYNMTKGSPAFG